MTKRTFSAQYWLMTKRLLSFVVSVLSAFATLALMYAIISPLSSGHVSGLFAFKNGSDILLTFLVVLAVITPIVYAIRLWIKHHNGIAYGNDLTKLLLILSFMLSSVSLVSIALSQSKVTLANVKYMEQLTYVSHYAVFASLTVGYILSLFIIRKRLNTYPILALPIIAPYVLMGYITINGYRSFNSFITTSYVNTKSLYKALKWADGDLALLNPTQFTLLMWGISVLLILIGVKVYVFVWKKTKNWRKAK